jgi:UDP-N-acetylglucosamine 2-epimerase (non-hydrolysing)
LVGTQRARIVSAVEELLETPAVYEAMARSINPYGDGFSVQRIVQVLEASRAAAPASTPCARDNSAGKAAALPAV